MPRLVVVLLLIGALLVPFGETREPVVIRNFREGAVATTVDGDNKPLNVTIEDSEFTTKFVTIRNIVVAADEPYAVSIVIRRTHFALLTFINCNFHSSRVRVLLEDIALTEYVKIRYVHLRNGATMTIDRLTATLSVPHFYLGPGLQLESGAVFELKHSSLAHPTWTGGAHRYTVLYENSAISGAGTEFRFTNVTIAKPTLRSYGFRESAGGMLIMPSVFVRDGAALRMSNLSVALINAHPDRRRMDRRSKATAPCTCTSSTVRPLGNSWSRRRLSCRTTQRRTVPLRSRSSTATGIRSSPRTQPP